MGVVGRGERMGKREGKHAFLATTQGEKGELAHISRKFGVWGFLLSVTT